MPGQAGLLDAAGGHFQGGEQGDDAVADVVVGLLLGNPGHDRKDWSGPVSGPTGARSYSPAHARCAGDSQDTDEAGLGARKSAGGRRSAAGTQPPSARTQTLS